jgi:hypothetical protein
MLSNAERIAKYSEAFPNYPPGFGNEDWLLMNWSVGNCYTGSGYHGSFPHSYLKRMRVLFPEFTKDDTLHLFSGSLSAGFESEIDWQADFPGTTVDINPTLKPDICCNAEELSKHTDKKFKMILADPPYTEEDAGKYGVALCNRNKVVEECYKVLEPGGILCWMDMVLPMYSKKKWRRFGEIMISRSTNHRVRAVFIFERL